MLAVFFCPFFGVYHRTHISSRGSWTPDLSGMRSPRRWVQELDLLGHQQGTEFRSETLDKIFVRRPFHRPPPGSERSSRFRYRPRCPPVAGEVELPAPVSRFSSWYAAICLQLLLRAVERQTVIVGLDVGRRHRYVLA